MRRAVPIAALALTIAVRASAAPFAVNTVADGHDATPGDGVCETASGNGICTLRAAIEPAGERRRNGVCRFRVSVCLNEPMRACQPRTVQRARLTPR